MLRILFSFLLINVTLAAERHSVGNETGENLQIIRKVKQNQCHTHEHETVIEKGDVTLPLTCADHQANIRAIHHPEYGSMTENECSELCSSPEALPFLEGWELGSCAETPEGNFINNPVYKSVPLEMSAINVEVVVAGKVSDLSTTCHCHDYDRMSCDDSNVDYTNYVSDLIAGCSGVRAGLDATCPTGCSVPFGILHLHYSECPSREMSEMFESILSTGKCHDASDTPSDVSICSPEERDPITTPVIDQSSDSATVFSTAAALAIGVVTTMLI